MRLLHCALRGPLRGSMRLYSVGSVPPIKSRVQAAGAAPGAAAGAPPGAAAGAPAAAAAPPSPRRTRPQTFRWGLVFGLLAGLAAGAYDNNLISLEDARTVQPPTKTEPFPKQLEIKSTPFEIVGVGVRTVSFLRIHVYAVGIYIASADRLKARTALVAAGADASSLMDEKKSVEVVEALLASGVRLAVRITPVRNTEFSHLRDGFVRSIMSHPAAKEAAADESFGSGLADLKRAFGRKRKATKQDSIYMVRTPTGGLDAIYSPFQGSPEDLGHVEDLNVARVFFLQYLSGTSPNSPSAREDAVRGLLALAG